MGSNQKATKFGVKRMRRCGIFSLSLSCFIMMSVLSSSLSFSIFSIDADERAKGKIPGQVQELDIRPLVSTNPSNVFPRAKDGSGLNFGKPKEASGFGTGTGLNPNWKIGPVQEVDIGPLVSINSWDAFNQLADERKNWKVPGQVQEVEIHPLVSTNPWNVFNGFNGMFPRAQGGSGVDFGKPKEASGTGTQPKLEIGSVDSLAQSFINMMLTTVNTINDELSARNQSPPNDNEDSSPDFILKMKDMGVQIKDEILHQFNKTAHKIHTVQHQIQDKVETQVDKIKEKGLSIFNDIKSKLMPHKNSSQPENGDQELSEEREMDFFDLEKNENIPEISNQNVDLPSSTSNSSTLTPPQFFLDDGFEGYFYAPISSKWETECVNLPSPFSGEISSVKTGGHCLYVCPVKSCKASWGIGNLRTHCRMIGGSGVNALSKLGDTGFGNKIKSFKKCQ